MKSPKHVDLKQEEVEALRARLKRRELNESDYELLDGVLQFVVWLQFALKEAKISIGRLSRLFGISRNRKKRQSSGKEEDEDPSSEDEGDSWQDSALNASQRGEKRKGHGRNPHASYTGATTVEVSQSDLKAGDPCPLECGGRLYEISPGVIVRVTGSPLVSATRFILEKLRCALCGASFTASLPEGVDPLERYDESAKAVLALQKYFWALLFIVLKPFSKCWGCLWLIQRNLNWSNKSLIVFIRFFVNW